MIIVRINLSSLGVFHELCHELNNALSIIYTTNPIEGVHRQLRKITKSKGAFSSDQALLKLMYLIVKDISRKWTMPIHNWGMAFSQLYIKFGDRILKEGINN